MNFYDIEVATITGDRQKLSAYRGKTLLIVNVASECGFTPQYKGLQALYDQYKDKGLVVLGFPCDQFGHQEPGSNAEIAKFCSAKFHVTFPMFEKIEVNGPNTHPLYQYLKAEKKGMFGTESIKWNFTKFLVDGSGNVVKRYAPADTPETIGSELATRLR
jgi:glutathione peroxidase